MNVLKIISLMIVIIIPAYIGTGLSSQYLNRINVTDDLVKTFEFIKQNVKYENRTIIEIIEIIIKNNGKNKLFYQEILSRMQKNGKSIENSWNESIDTIKNIKEEKILIKEFSTYFGCSADVQVKGMEYVIEGLLQIENGLKSEKKEKCKIYRCFGVLSGIFFAIILS